MTPADVHDSKPAPALLDLYMDEPGRLLKLVWADSAYQGQPWPMRAPGTA
ncbi:transposase [Streptomyces sp. NPDC091280]